MNAIFPFSRPDSLVVRQVLGGDPRAFEVLVARYQKQAYAVSHAHGVEPSGVEDVVQQSFLRAFRALPGLREPERFGPWFLRIVENAARNDVERRRSFLPLEPASDEAPGRLEPESAPTAEPLESRELREHVWRKVAELPAGTREAIFLYYQDGESVGRVAKSLQISATAVKQRLKRGRDLLRESLWRELGDTLKDMLPSARQWRQRARTMSLIIFAALPTTSAVTAGTAVQAASLSSFSTISRVLSGALAMSSKKIALSALFALLVSLGGLFLLSRLSGSKPLPVEIAARGADAGASNPATAAAGDRTKTSDSAAASTLAAAAGTPGALPVSIQGRVTCGDAGVAGARIRTLSLPAWQKIAGGESNELDLAKKLARLSKAFRQELTAAPAVESGPDGAFSVRGLAAGDYRLVTAHPEHLPHWETLVSVPPQGAAEAEIRLTLAQSIRGQVVDDAGKPIAGAVVEAEPFEMVALKGQTRLQKQLLDWEDGQAALGEARTESAADGTFVLGSLSPGAHALWATHGQYLAGDALDAPAGESQVVLTLRRGASVRGRLVDVDLRPVGGVLVKLTPARLTEVHRIYDWSGSEVEAVEAKARDARSAQDGRFQVDGLEPRAYELAAAAGKLAPLFREVEVPPDGIDLGDVELSAPLDVSGVVLAPDGKPLPGARVWAALTETSVRAGNTLGLRLAEAVAETRSGAQGRFTLTGLPGGPLDLGAEAEDYAGLVLEGVAAGSGDVKLTLEEGITIHGKIIDSTSLEPVAGAVIQAGFSRLKSAASDAEGVFVIRGLPIEEIYGGSTVIRASHAELGSQREHNVMVLGRSESSPLVIRLGAALQTLRGTVADEAGKPVANAQVWVESTVAEASGFTATVDRRTITAADGAFSLPEPVWLRHTVEGFKISVVASHPKYATSRTGLLDTPATGEPWQTLNLVLTSGSVLEGKVTSEDGGPIGGARITVWRVPPEVGRATHGLGSLLSARTGFSARDGAYRIAALEPGLVEVVVEASGHARSGIDGLTLGAQPLRQDFQLTPGASIRGRVVDTQGAPLAGVEVTAVLEGEASQDPVNVPAFARRMDDRTRAGMTLAWTRQDGRFELAGLPEGPFTVLARASGYDAGKVTGVREGETVPDLVLPRFSGLRGRVLEMETGRPITNFSVNVIDKAQRRAETSVNDWRVGSQGELRYSDPLGRFVYDGLRPGECEVIIMAKGFLAETLDQVLGAGEELPLEARLSRGARIEGRTLDAETALPVGGVTVDCLRQLPREAFEAEMKRGGFARAPMAPPSGMGSTTSGADGRFVLDGLIAGEYTLNATHPFYILPGRRAERVTLSEGVAERRDLSLEATGRIEGTIGGLQHEAGKGHRVNYGLYLERMGDGENARGAPGSIEASSAYVDPTGRFQADGVPPGRYRILLRKQEFKPGKFVEMSPGAGTQALEPVGGAKTIPLGELEVRSREVATLHCRVETD